MWYIGPSPFSSEGPVVTIALVVVGFFVASGGVIRFIGYAIASEVTVETPESSDVG